MDLSRDQVRRIMIAVSRIDETYFQTVRTLGIPDHLFVLLYAISDGGSYSQKQICDAWKIPRSTLNSVVKDSVRKGYVALVPSGHKEKNIVLTDAGTALAQKILAPVFEAEAAAIAPFLSTHLAEDLECFTEKLEQEFQAKLQKRSDNL